MRFFYVFIIAAASFIVSCNSNKRKYDEIDMEKAFHNLQLEDGAALFRDIEVVELDDTVDMFLGPVPCIEAVMTDDIVIRSSNDIYHFSRKGKYLNPIGKYGNGHTEHGQILSVSCDTINKEVYVSTLSSDVYVYTFDGSFLRKYKLKVAGNEIIKSTCYSQKHGLMAELRQHDGTKNNVLIATSNAEGDIVNRELIYSDNFKFPVSRESTSEMYCYGDGVKIKLEYSGILFCVGDDNCPPVELTHGNQIPDRRLIENASLKSKLMDKYVQVLDVRESDKYLYLVLYKKGSMRCAVYDKQSQRFVFSQGDLNPKLGEGIILRDINKKFWPNWTGGNLAASVILPEYNGDSDEACNNYRGTSIIIAHEQTGR